MIGFDQLPEYRAGHVERSHRRSLIHGHQARITRRICDEDRRQPLPHWNVAQKRHLVGEWRELYVATEVQCFSAVGTVL
ncbi:MAG: hypothetical protein ACREXT_09070 [Gammaproteobacteria bacterium]